MKNALLAIFVVPFLVMPAFAGSSTAGDKPMVVADNVEIGVGVGHRHRDEVRIHHHHHHHDDRH